MRFVYCNGHNSTSLFSGSPGKKEKMNISIKEETLGQRIRAQRIRLGMTQEELAEEMCVPKSTISAYENDRVDIKSWNDSGRIGGAFVCEEVHDLILRD